MRKFYSKIKRSKFSNQKLYFWFCKRDRFWWKTKKINKKVTSNKTKHVLVENKLNEQKVKAISTKGLTKDLINKYSTFNGAKYFLGILENYFIFISAKKILNILMPLLGFLCWSVMECQKKALKI